MSHHQKSSKPSLRKMFLGAGFSISQSVFKAVLMCGVLASSAGGEAALAVLDLSQLVKKVGPSVASIQSTRFVDANVEYSRFLDLTGGSRNSAPAAKGGAKQVALGSGFVVLAGNEVSKSQGIELREAYLLTNSHVIKGAQEIEILFAGSSVRFQAVVVGADSIADIAVLKARIPASVESLKFAASRECQVGEAVFAIGNPFGLGHTVTAGILSAKDRSLGIGRIDRYLQTDAAINFGNSGGPLFNKNGEVIGMNTLVRADARGIGFAIPSDTIQKMLPALQKGQAVARAWLGLAVEASHTANRKFYKVSDDPDSLNGVIITKVFQGSPADVIGLKTGDLVVSYTQENKQIPLRSPLELKDWVESLQPGQEAELIIRRQSKVMLAKIKVEALPETYKQAESYYESY
jgi:serine protease Do